MSYRKLFFTTIISITALGGNLGAPISLPAAKVLPKGVRNINYKGITTSGTDKYNSAGDVRALADPFYQDMSFEKILAGEHDPIKRGEIVAAMLKVGASTEDSFGYTQGQVNAEVYASALIFAYGVSTKITTAIAIPVIKTSLNVDTGVVHTNNDLYNAMVAQLEIAAVKKVEFDEKMLAPVTDKMTKYAYEDLVNEDETKLGDIKLVTKYQAVSNKLNAVVLGASITLPTGRIENPNKLVDLPGGDGQTDLGLSVNYDLHLATHFTTSLLLSHTFQFADTVEKRVPFYRGSKLTPYIDDSTDRDLGDISMFQIAQKATINGWTLGLGYSFQYKDEDEYTGTKYDPTWYTYISKDSVQRMQNITATVSFSTIPLFKQKKFPVPLAFSVTHSQTVEGKNVTKDPMTTMDMSIFF